MQTRAEEYFKYADRVLAAGNYHCEIEEAIVCSEIELKKIIKDYFGDSNTKIDKIFARTQKLDDTLLLFPNIQRDETPSGIAWSSTSPIFPLSCRATQFLDENKLAITFSTLLFIFLFSWFLKWRSDRKLYNEALALVTEIQKTLKFQHKHLQYGASSPPFIAQTHLRDTLLTVQPSKQKQKIWKIAQDLISKDTRIQSYETIEHGKQTSVLEWISNLSE